MDNKEIKKLVSARSVALVGLMTATLTCGKLALSFIPNVEVITLLLALYGYVFGIYGAIAAFLFVLIEPLIYGFGTWLIYYLLYWPAVALVFMLLGKKKINKRWIFCLAAMGLTFIFGILSSVIDSAMMLGINANYLKNLIIYYIRGIPFYLIHIISNSVIFVLVYPFLQKKLEHVRQNKNL